MFAKYFRISRYHKKENSPDDIMIIFPESVDYHDMLKYYDAESIVSYGFVNLDSKYEVMNFCFSDENGEKFSNYPEYHDTTLLRTQYTDDFNLSEDF